MYDSINIESLYEGLNDEDKGLAVDYLKYLFYRSKSKKAENTNQVFAQIDKLLENEKTWASEDELLAELSEYRRTKTEV